MSDPDGMGATPTHQSDMQTTDINIWGPKDGHVGEILLPVPFRDPNSNRRGHQEGLLNVEGQAVRKSRRQKEHEDGSTGSTVPVSTPAMRGLWSCTTSYMSEGEIYPDEHPFIRNLRDSDNPDETPYTATTTGFPLYKGSYATIHNEAPPGFKRNDGDNFISFPITAPDGEVWQAEYVQVILHPNPIVVGLCNNSNKVFTGPLYAVPVFRYNGKPVYKAKDLEGLKEKAEGAEKTNHMIQHLHDPSLTAEIHRFHMILNEIERIEEAIAAQEDQWGEVAALQVATI